MWTPPECGASFNWSIASTSAEAFLAGVVRRRFAASCWLDEELIIVPSAKGSKIIYGYREVVVFGVSNVIDLPIFEIHNPLKIKIAQDGSAIAIDRMPVMYRCWKC